MNCQDNKQGSLTPIATDDDHPTPRFNPNGGEESPVATFGLPPEDNCGAHSDRVVGKDTCQYVMPFSLTQTIQYTTETVPTRGQALARPIGRRLGPRHEAG